MTIVSESMEKTQLNWVKNPDIKDSNISLVHVATSQQKEDDYELLVADDEKNFTNLESDAFADFKILDPTRAITRERDIIKNEVMRTNNDVMSREGES